MRDTFTGTVPSHSTDIRAAELMGRLHDAFVESGQTQGPIETLLVRLLFCFFAEDTGAFDEGSFRGFIERRLGLGAELGAALEQLFEVMDSPAGERSGDLEEDLAGFPYVNGGLFADRLGVIEFDSAVSDILLECCELEWRKISPAIFGAMFQVVRDSSERRHLGAHYTSERNILKVIEPLFLDELKAELQQCRGKPRRLEALHRKLGSLTFLDPACGCGNFLVIVYRELRMLELEILRELHGDSPQGILDVSALLRVGLHQLYGIECEEWPARIAEIALWLTDHQLNLQASRELGQYFVRLPLERAATIVHGNALRIDWADIIPPDELDYILGNPPYIGHHMQTREQKADLHHVLHDVRAAGVMDYVSAWYYKAADFIEATQIKVAFVSTNSIAQGEQCSILWTTLFENFSPRIHFAHRTFRWDSEVRGRAAVHVVIIGFGADDSAHKVIYRYDDPSGEPNKLEGISNINPYLVDAPDVLVVNRTKPLCDVPGMMYGNKPTDGGHFLFTDEEKDDFLAREPLAARFLRPLLSAREFLNNKRRWCLWLVDVAPAEVDALPLVNERVEQVRAFRAASKAAATRDYPHHALFRQVTQPQSDFVLVPRHSSQNRTYIPFGFFPADHIVHDSCSAIPDATLYHFGVLTSEMHMTWVKNTCGRIKSDYRYSKDIVYNNFPWPAEPGSGDQGAVEAAAQAVVDAREAVPGASLAELYDPSAMPTKLTKAHVDLDRAVDHCYGEERFASDGSRMSFLLGLYGRYVTASSL